jgi:hypothetical protein
LYFAVPAADFELKYLSPPFKVMSQVLIESKTTSAYQHGGRKYQSLDSKNQTPATFIVGQKYKVGTGLVLIRREDGLKKEILLKRCSYKQFLSYLLKDPLQLESIEWFKWAPARRAKQSRLSEGNCIQDCIDTCVKPGCICNKAEKKCM